jgi:hypothetical protein
LSIKKKWCNEILSDIITYPNICPTKYHIWCTYLSCFHIFRFFSKSSSHKGLEVICYWSTSQLGHRSKASKFWSHFFWSQWDIRACIDVTNAKLSYLMSLDILICGHWYLVCGNWSMLLKNIFVFLFSLLISFLYILTWMFSETKNFFLWFKWLECDTSETRKWFFPS